jgi:hypothetical protein
MRAIERERERVIGRIKKRIVSESDRESDGGGEMERTTDRGTNGGMEGEGMDG